MRKKLFFCFALSSCTITPLFAQSGVAFLTVAPDAASSGVAGSKTSYSTGAFATYWNPAGLGAGTGQELAVGYHIWTEDVRTYVGAARFNMGKNGGLGLALTAAGVTGLAYREAPGEALGTFGAQFGSLQAAYGLSLGKHLRAGLGGKLINERLDTYSARGVALDAGLQAEFANGDLQAGLALRNWGKMNALDAEATELPTTLQGGIMLQPFKVIGLKDNATLLKTALSIEAAHLFPNEKSHVLIGLSSQVLDVLTVRAGYKSNDELRRFTFGAGFESGKLKFDYAYLPYPAGFNDAHILTLRYFY